MSGMPHFPSFFFPLAQVKDWKKGGRGRKKPQFSEAVRLLTAPLKKKRGRPNEWPNCPRLFELAREHPDKSISGLLGLLWDEKSVGGREKYIENRLSRLPPGVREHVRLIQEAERTERADK